MGEKIIKSKGVNQSENRLVRLGEKIFFDLWSYPNLHYDPGKELADLLVICGEHVLIFSDKNIKFNMDKEGKIAWERWHKKAILNSIVQLRMAERRIRDFPDKIFLDSKCTKKLPIAIPKQSEIKVHLVCVANGVEEACKNFFDNGEMFDEVLNLIRDSVDPALLPEKKLFKTLKLERATTEKLYTKSSSGSLSFDLYKQKEGIKVPFCTTDYDKSKTFIHVFNDNFFAFVLNELDTLSDFTRYLTEKERFIRKLKSITYCGEEDLLFNYVTNFDNERNCHTFVGRTIEDKIESSDSTLLPEGNWDELRKTHRYKSKKEADKISYMWDDMIRDAVHFRLNSETCPYLHEDAIRYMALEDRVHRRNLSVWLKNRIESYPIDKKVFVSVCVELDSNQAYVFLQMDRLQNKTYEQYRKERFHMLEIYICCLKAKLTSEHSEIRVDRIIGHAIEPAKLTKGVCISEDFCFLDSDDWSNEEQLKYNSIRKDLNIFTPPLIPSTFNEYPENSKYRPLSV